VFFPSCKTKSILNLTTTVPGLSDVYLDYPRTLEELGVLSITETDSLELDTDEISFSGHDGFRRGKIKVFSLTDEGIKVGKVHYDRLTVDQRRILERIKGTWTNRSLQELIDYSYLNFTDHSKHSNIKEQVYSKLDVSPELKSLIGIIPLFSLNEEKRVIRETIRSRLTR